jgi:hypothetical protein
MDPLSNEFLESYAIGGPSALVGPLVALGVNAQAPAFGSNRPGRLPSPGLSLTAFQVLFQSRFQAFGFLLRFYVRHVSRDPSSP